MEYIAAFICLLVTGAVDIRKKAVPVWMIAVAAVSVPVVKTVKCVLYGSGVSARELAVAAAFTAGLVSVCRVTRMLGVADALMVGVTAFLVGTVCAVSVFMLALMAVSLFSGMMLVMRKVRIKDTVPFLPFMVFSYAGVMLCG